MTQARLALAIGLLAASAVGLSWPAAALSRLADADPAPEGLRTSFNDLVQCAHVPMMMNNETNLAQKFSWFTHHKSGSELSYALSNLLSEHIGAGCRRIVGWGYSGQIEEVADRNLGDPTLLADYRASSRFMWTETWNEEWGEGCTKSMVSVHANILPQQFRKADRQCPNFKGVHMSRDPVEILLSGYTYHTTKPGSYDCLPNACTNIHLDRSIADGLKVEAADEMRYVIQPMMEMLKIAMCDHRMLPLTMESHFEVDYDNTSRTLLRHMLAGTPYEKDIEELVVKFAQEDSSRTDASGIHDTDGDLKDKARATLETIKDDPRIAPIFEAKRQFDAIWAAGCTQPAE